MLVGRSSRHPSRTCQGMLRLSWSTGSRRLWQFTACEHGYIGVWSACHMRERKRAACTIHLRFSAVICSVSMHLHAGHGVLGRVMLQGFQVMHATS
jgi:hypothetical protein